MGEDPLITAVRSGDEDAVRLLLEDGADPDAVDEQGSPALCLAISAFNSTIAGYLVEGGADPDRQLSDGTTPRLRAVDSGSIGLAHCLLGAAAQLSEATRVELLARAGSGMRWARSPCCGSEPAPRTRSSGSGSGTGNGPPITTSSGSAE